MGNQRASGDWQGMAQLSAAALDKMKRLDFDLRKLTDQSNNELFVSGTDEAPAKYRDQVNEYYRQLSKKAGSGTSANTKGTP
jgi:hypothetical protein